MNKIIKKEDLTSLMDMLFYKVILVHHRVALKLSQIPEELVQEEYLLYITDIPLDIPLDIPSDVTFTEIKLGCDVLIGPSIHYSPHLHNEMAVYMKYEVWKSLVRNKKIEDILK